MKSSLRNSYLVCLLALASMVLQRGALAQLKSASDDTILVVCAGGTFPKINNDPTTANRRFIPFHDQLTVVEAILESEQRDLGPEVFKVEIIRGDQIIQLDVDLKQERHHPSSPTAENVLKRGDVMIVRPKQIYW